MGASSTVLQTIVVTLDHALNDVRPDAPAVLLRSLGHQVTVVGYDFAELAGRRVSADLVVVEAGSHLEIGKDAIKRLRDREELAGTGILICVDVTRVAGLDVQMGADDFILMPLAGDELAARLRQLKWRGTAQNPAGRSRYGGIILDTTSLQAFSAGQSLKLTPYEFQLLKFLVERAGRVFTREELLSRVWGYRHVGRVRTVDTHILNLRGKLGAAGELLEAVRGMGYKLKKLENQQSEGPRAQLG
jgi:two-component system phosphate regulon response regulator PhoB